MPITKINQDSYVKASEIYDNTYWRNRYLTDNTVFDNPLMELVSDNYEFLSRNTYYVNMDKKYIGRPDYLSYDIYGSTNLWFLLLYMNGCYCLEDFNMSKVYVPSIESINQVLRNYISGEIKKV